LPPCAVHTLWTLFSRAAITCHGETLHHASRRSVAAVRGRTRSVDTFRTLYAFHTVDSASVVRAILALVEYFQ
jgi:hypothetical protein